MVRKGRGEPFACFPPRNHVFHHISPHHKVLKFQKDKSRPLKENNQSYWKDKNKWVALKGPSVQVIRLKYWYWFPSRTAFLTHVVCVSVSEWVVWWEVLNAARWLSFLAVEGSLGTGSTHGIYGPCSIKKLSFCFVPGGKVLTWLLHFNMSLYSTEKSKDREICVCACVF